MTPRNPTDFGSLPCAVCGDTGWLVRHYYICSCRAGDYAFAKWEGMTIHEYDERARGTSDYHGTDPAYMVAAS